MELKTPLYASHVEAKGKMVPFAGYLLPVQYEKGVIAEHLAVREKAGLFDVSHMGEVLLEGKDALANLQFLMTNDFSNLQDNRVRYSPMCNEQGGVVDDLIVYRYHEESYLLVVNASNKEKDVAWIKAHLFGEVRMKDVSEQMAQIALQGPLAETILATLVMEENRPSKYYSFVPQAMVGGVPCLISKTGYTGEDGYELYCAPEHAVILWQSLLQAGAPFGLIPCGLGARDTLRLEAAMPLYGHEMTDDITPMETGLGNFVKLNKADFIGKAAILAKGEPSKMRVGLKMTGRGIAREDSLVYAGETLIGKTTSGTHCPYLGAAMAMALIDPAYGALDTPLEVEVRGRRISALVVNLPFYKKGQAN